MSNTDKPLVGHCVPVQGLPERLDGLAESVDSMLREGQTLAALADSQRAAIDRLTRERDEWRETAAKRAALHDEDMAAAKGAIEHLKAQRDLALASERTLTTYLQDVMGAVTDARDIAVPEIGPRLAKAVAELVRQRDEARAGYVPQEVATRALELLDEAGIGQPGRPNTLLAMVAEACEAMKLHRRALERLCWQSAPAPEGAYVVYEHAAGGVFCELVEEVESPDADDRWAPLPPDSIAAALDAAREDTP